MRAPLPLNAWGDGRPAEQGGTFGVWARPRGCGLNWRVNARTANIVKYSYLVHALTGIYISKKRCAPITHCVLVRRVLIKYCNCKRARGLGLSAQRVSSCVICKRVYRLGDPFYTKMFARCRVVPFSYQRYHSPKIHKLPSISCERWRRRGRPAPGHPFDLRPGRRRPLRSCRLADILRGTPASL